MGKGKRDSAHLRAANAEKKAASEKKKALGRAIITVIISFVVLCIVLLALYGIRASIGKRSEAAKEPSNLNLEGKSYINYYTPDYSADIFEDADYLAKNRTIRYIVPTDSGEISFVLDEQEESDMTEGQRFFVRYFDSVIRGDYEAYHDMFDEAYKKNPGGFEKDPTGRAFPMQRIYDITVRELMRTDPYDDSYNYNGDPALFGVYEVSYKILKNDGEFRYDLPEGGEVPVVVELVTTGLGTDGEYTRIKDIYRYGDIAFD